MRGAGDRPGRIRSALTTGIRHRCQSLKTHICEFVIDTVSYYRMIRPLMRHAFYWAVMPPSITSSAPVMNALSSEAR